MIRIASMLAVTLVGGALNRPALGAVLTLDQAIRLTLDRNPGARALDARHRAALARRPDAGRLANPELSLQAENLGVTGRRETTVGVSQSIELGGERGARRDLVEALADRSGAEQRAGELASAALTAERFIEVWALQQRVALLHRAVSAADDAIAGARERFRQGAAPAQEQVRAEAARAIRAAEERRTAAQLDAARRLLALSWGGGTEVDSVTLADPETLVVPPVDSLLARLASHPERLAAAAAIAAEEARLREARAATVPDLALRAGWRRLEEADDSGLEAGVAVALPIWNRARGAVTAARLERDGAVAQADAAGLALEVELRNAHAMLAAELASLRELRRDVTPRAREALELLRSSYRAGRSGALEMAEAQRAVVEAGTAEIEAARNAWRERAALARLSGVALVAEGGAR